MPKLHSVSLFSVDSRIFVLCDVAMLSSTGHYVTGPGREQNVYARPEFKRNVVVNFQKFCCTLVCLHLSSCSRPGFLLSASGQSSPILEGDCAVPRACETRTMHSVDCPACEARR